MNDKVKTQVIDVCLDDDNTFKVLSDVLGTTNHDVMMRSLGLTKLFIKEKKSGNRVYIEKKKNHWWERTQKIEIMDI